MQEALPPLFLKPGDPPKVVASLCEDLRIPEDITRTVQISYRTYQHIISRRAEEEAWHAELVLRRMASVITSPSHVGIRDGRRARMELYSRADGDPCGVLVSVKCLHRETWVNTAFPAGERTLLKHVRTGRLEPLDRLQGTLFNIE